MTDLEVLAGEHEGWCEAHFDCCGRDCQCGRDERRDAIAAALAAEREKARAPFLALADEWEAGMRAMGYADGHHDGAAAIRKAAEGGS